MGFWLGIKIINWLLIKGLVTTLECEVKMKDLELGGTDVCVAFYNFIESHFV